MSFAPAHAFNAPKLPSYCYQRFEDESQTFKHQLPVSLYPYTTMTKLFKSPSEAPTEPKGSKSPFFRIRKFTAHLSLKDTLPIFFLCNNSSLLYFWMGKKTKACNFFLIFTLKFASHNSL